MSDPSLAASSEDPGLTAPAEVPAPPPGPSAQDRALLVAAGLGGGLGVFVFYSLMQLLLATALTDRLRLALVLAQVGGLFVPTLAFLAAARQLGVLPAARPPRQPRPGLALGVALWTSGFALCVMGLVTSALALLAPKALEAMMRFGMEMYEPLFRVGSPADVWAILAVVTIVPAACEELLFRGGIQRILRGALSPAWAIGITSLLFALVHLEPLGLVSRFILAVGLGIAYERTGSLRLSMFGHALHNLVTVLLFPWEGEPVLPMRHEAAVALAALVPGAAIAGFLWWRTLRALPGEDRA